MLVLRLVSEGPEVPPAAPAAEGPEAAPAPGASDGSGGGGGGGGARRIASIEQRMLRRARAKMLAERTILAQVPSPLFLSSRPPPRQAPSQPPPPSRPTLCVQGKFDMGTTAAGGGDAALAAGGSFSLGSMQALFDDEPEPFEAADPDPDAPPGGGDKISDASLAPARIAALCERSISVPAPAADASLVPDAPAPGPEAGLGAGPGFAIDGGVFEAQPLGIRAPKEVTPCAPSARPSFLSDS